MSPDAGVWICRYSDMSSVKAFGSEIEALRYAVEHQMECTWVQWGEEIRP